MEHLSVEPDFRLPFEVCDGGCKEREGNMVAGGSNDYIEIKSGAVSEVHGFSGHAVNSSAGLNLAVAHIVEKL